MLQLSARKMLHCGGTLQGWVPLKDTQFPTPEGTQPESEMITNKCLDTGLCLWGWGGAR